MKVCVFGDSIVKGVIYDSKKQRYSMLKDNFINMIQQHSNIEIESIACFGCTITKGMNLLEKVENELKNYDYTFLEFGGNDCDFNWAAVAENPDINHDCNTPIEDFKEKYIYMIKKIQAAGSRPVLVTLPPIDSKRFFNWVSKGLDKEKILGFLGDVEHIGRWQSMYSDAVKQISKLFNLPLFDIRSIFFNQKNSITDYLCEDGIHPNKEGHKLIYRAIAERTSLVPMMV
ncbi:MAG TPA: SGNH/GDSL hydrolase family protein [Clostridiales bacterium]|nr:SGNH/GDSL hydrolase family protein [Clostridiales bacterium]